MSALHTIGASRLAAAQQPAAVLQRACACGNHAPGGECESCRKRRLQRSAYGPATPDVAPPSVHDVLASPGQPLDTGTRAFMESRFGQDFSRVRVHADARAAESARAVNAHAYTVGSHIAFGSSQYTPGTSSGRRLLAHELTHVVQQDDRLSTPAVRLTVDAPDSAAEREAGGLATRIADGRTLPHIASTVPGMLHRLPNLSWEGIRNAAYQRLINGMRSAQEAGLTRLRRWAAGLSGTQQSIATGIVTAVEGITGFLIQLVLAVVGVVVGFVSGIVQAVIGLIRLLLGIITGILLFLYGFIDGGRRFDEWAEGVAEGLRNLLPGLRALVTNWLDQFNRASTDRQVIMIGELTGQILALIATFEFVAARAGSVPRVILSAGARSAEALATTGRAITTTGAAISIDVASPAAAGALGGAYAMSAAGSGGGGENDPPRARRSKHSEQRRTEGRRVGQAFNDAQRARPGDVFVEESNGRYVVRGARGREYIFEPDGELVTSIDRPQSAHLGRLRNGVLRPITLEEFEIFKQLFQ